MKSKLKSLKDLYTALGGNSADVLGANSVIAVLNGILALGSVDGCQFVPDAIKAIADNLSSIDPSPAATLIEKTITENGTYTATTDNADGYSAVTVNVPAPTLTGFNEENAKINDHVYIGYYDDAPTTIVAVRLKTSPYDPPTGLNVLGVVIGWASGPE